MSNARRTRRQVQQRRRSASTVAIASATTAVALTAGLTLATPPAHASNPTCSAPSTEVSPGVFEVRITSTTACDWTVPADAINLEALLVGSGGKGTVISPVGYGGGGGEVVLVNLTGTTGAITAQVGVTNADAPKATSADTTLIASTTHTALGGWGGGTIFGAGGQSGNLNAGHSSGGGGGAGGAAPEGGNGGAGVVVSTLAAAGSLFVGDSRCFGGGGAVATYSGSSPVTAFDARTPGCGGGALSTTTSLPADVASLTIVSSIGANTGGGGPAEDGTAVAQDAQRDGSNGLVLIRYNVELPASGADPTPLATLGALFVAAGTALLGLRHRVRRTASA